MKKALSVAAVALTAVTQPAMAGYIIDFAEDVAADNVPLTAAPLSDAKAGVFANRVTGVRTETFETFRVGEVAPLTLQFQGAAGEQAIDATLTGAGGQIANGVGNTTGLYGLPLGNENAQFWRVSTGSGNQFEVTFTRAVAAFGFYGIDIGDLDAQLYIDFYRGDNMLASKKVDHTVNSNGENSGSVLFFGATGESAADDFTKVVFRSVTGAGVRSDGFGFDNFTVASRGQLTDQPTDPNNPVPVPGTLLLAGLGLVLAGARAGAKGKQRG